MNATQTPPSLEDNVQILGAGKDDPAASQRRLVDVTPISGFPEWMPNVKLAEQRFVFAIQKQYELFGFTPIETPAVERWEALTTKGGMHRQIFAVNKPEDDDGKADLGLHFDLTVPLARYVVQHSNDLTFPFRRYQIQKVWRGERAQRGRFREFYQCDIDVIGRGALDLIHDAEIPCVINSTFEALHLPPFKIHISNRKILTSLLRACSTPDVVHAEALRVIDNLGKGATTVALEMGLVAAGCTASAAAAVSILLKCASVRIPTRDSLRDARAVFASNNADQIGLDELEQLLRSTAALGMPENRITVDFSIARGLDYYTGTVYETFIEGKEAWGSVCSGGRFDDLAEHFTTQRFPGVGISIGLTRLFNLLVEAAYVDVSKHTPTVVLVTMQDRSRFLEDYLGIGRRMREAGIPTEVYLDPVRLGDQLSYASKKGICFAVIAGEQELNLDLHCGEPTVQIKDLLHGTQEEIAEIELPTYVRRKVNEVTNL